MFAELIPTEHLLKLSLTSMKTAISGFMCFKCYILYYGLLWYEVSLKHRSSYGLSNVQENELIQVSSVKADGGILPMLRYFWFSSVKIPLSDSWQL